MFSFNSYKKLLFSKMLLFVVKIWFSFNSLTFLQIKKVSWKTQGNEFPSEGKIGLNWYKSFYIVFPRSPKFTPFVSPPKISRKKQISLKIIKKKFNIKI